MKNFKDLPPQVRAEIDSAVHDAYVGEDGSIRTHAEASELFDKFIVDAIQAHRQWPGILLDAWRAEGRRRFVRDRWKYSEIFRWFHKGKQRQRTERRGARHVDDDGGQRWVQESLFGWDIDKLKDAIVHCVGRIEEERANIAMYRALIDLLEETGSTTVQAGLKAKGTTLEEFLAEKAA